MIMRALEKYAGFQYKFGWNAVHMCGRRFFPGVMPENTRTLEEIAYPPCVCANTVQYRVVRRKKKIREIGLFTVQNVIKKSLRGALFKLTPLYRKAPLTLDELERLIEATSQGPVRSGLSGHVRAALYLLCATSGLRRSEAFFLKQTDVDLEKGILIVPASLSKNRKQASIPLPERTISFLKKIVTLPEAESSRPYFPWKTSVRNTSSGIYKIFLKDLEAAGIAREKPQGRICFHSLRLTYAYFLAVKGGLPIVVAQRLMRHSTPQLTSNIYINLGLNELTDAVQNAFADFNHQPPGPAQTSEPPLSSQTDQTPDHLSSRST